MANRSFYLGLGVAGAIGSALSITALAQPMTKPAPVDVEATIYRDADYSGPAVAIQAEEPNLGLAWRVTSIRVNGGEWQLCSAPNYRGNCTLIDRDRSRLGFLGRGMMVQSARYMGGGMQRPQPGDGGQSLRGMASQYYTMPMLYGEPVLACNGSATAACASDSADRFCASMGWRISVHERMETRSGRVVLRDVLCANADF